MSEQLDESIFGGGDVTDERGRYRRTRERRRRRRGGLRRWITLLVALGLVVVAGLAAKAFVMPIYEKITASEDYPGPGSGTVKVVIAAGQGGEAIASTLKDRGVIKTRGAYLEVARANEKAAAAIQPGTYTMKKEMTAADAFKYISNPANRSNPRVTVREGLWASEIYPILSKATGVPVASYVKAAKNPKAIGLPAAAKGNVEGYLFPSTYEFPEKASATTQLKMMVAKTTTELRKAGVAPADDEKVMILASLVEAEAKLDADRPKIARVFLNRLAAGPSGPTLGKLESDAAVSYGAKRRATYPSQKELADTSNPYNLRQRAGLPPGPISNPGAKSIEAAARPASGPWLFFVAVNLVTGETKYAVTLEEHNRNTAELRAWCKANPGNGC